MVACLSRATEADMDFMNALLQLAIWPGLRATPGLSEAFSVGSAHITVRP